MAKTNAENGKIDLTIEEERMNSSIEKALYNPDGWSIWKRLRQFLIAIIAITLAVYVIYYAAAGGFPAWQHRAVFTSIFLILCFSTFSYRKGKEPGHVLFDGVPLVLSIALLGHAFFSYPEIALRQGASTFFDQIVATVMILLVIEGVRRTIGHAMAILALFFWAYIFIGPMFPGILGHQGFSYSRMTDALFITTNGIFSDPIYVASTVLILFLIFAAFMMRTGVGQFFIEFAFALTGRIRGGPALASVLSSGLLATVSGNGAANASMTGPFTIPLMKRVGYTKTFSGAVEAVASQGGQIMPPIMGAAAFVMAEYTGVPYIEVAAYALLPAILFFTVVGVVIYFQAQRLGLQGIPGDQLPNFWSLIVRKGYLILPLIIIIVLMVIGYSPMRAGMWALLVVFLLSLVKKESRLSVMSIFAALEKGIRNAVPTVMACAGAGIIAGSVIMTGLGMGFSRFAVELSGGQLLPLLLLIMVASIILGMGMPTVSAYVILATVAAGALTQLGVPVLVAHFFVFYFGIFSGITPPVAITSFITAGIAGSNPLRTSVYSLRVGMAGFILPYMLVYNPTLSLEGSVPSVIFGITTALLGLVAFAGFIEGCMLKRTAVWERVALAAAAVLLVTDHLWSDLIGLGLLLPIFIYQWRGRDKPSEMGTVKKDQHSV
ncbi:TRAP transporter fused permease subunit [Salicibibacter halophilus]|uniref:TRAP transporter fused permease subunit n=1 Tax=Salicibibacter halophilus TaxID=2502791 RepID=A0A514LEP4_9BACI|nr:TRAP transporter fused permease subunit [Salicibibacter halophilus]QDI90317.1 TRAP transporter fused permease subunit [Salicibibacter halophilus]